MKRDVEYIISDIPIEYSNALEFMQNRVKQIQLSQEKQLIWFLQHKSVYTAGVNANENELLDKDKFPVVKTGRGGKYTYHGPGQRVVYLMLNLKEIHDGQPDLKKYVKQIEHWVINSLARIGINSFIAKDRIGVWTKDSGREEKIAAIGVRIQKWVTFHGVAINIHTNLDDFNGIVPCGITDYGVTSIDRLGIETTISAFDQILIEELSKTFSIDLFKSQLS